jgi:hypothetical protein
LYWVWWLWCDGIWEIARLHDGHSKSTDLSYLITTGSFYSSINNLTRRVRLCGFWSLGQSEYKVYRSSTKTILCKEGWNSVSKSRGKSKGIWT